VSRNSGEVCYRKRLQPVVGALGMKWATVKWIQ
jgi:hypothetical protein